MASIRSSSHYDSITAEDLFDSFMNVALSVEKEIQPKGHEVLDYQETLNCDSSKTKISPNNNVILQRENIYASCNDMVICNDECKLKQNISSNNVKESSDMNNHAYAVVDKLKSKVAPIQTSMPIHETHLNDESQTGLSSAKLTDNEMLLPEISIDYTANSSNPPEYELYAKPSKKNSVAGPGANLTDDLPTDISTTSSEDKYDIVGSIINSSINYESLDKYNVQQQSKERPVATVAPMVHDYKIKVEDVAFNKRLASAGCDEMYKSCLETIEKGNKSALLKTDPKSKKNFFGFQRSNSKEKLYKDISKYNNSFGPKTEVNNIEVLCDGYLFKQGGTGMTLKNWRLRWFELKKNNCLYYYKSQQDHVPSGAVILCNYGITRAPEVNKRFAFKVAKGGARSYYFAANSEEEMKKWMKFITESSRQPISEGTTIPECSLKNVSIPALSIQVPECHGYLWKQGNSHKGWRKRYCVMKYGCLFYYEDIGDQVAIGVFKLHNYVINKSEETKNGFQADPPFQKLRTYYFYTESEIDLRRWIEAMKHSINTVK